MVFGSETVFPEGFRYQPDFLSESEEAALLQAIQSETFKTFVLHPYLAERRTAEYGLEYDSGTRRATPTQHVPEFLLPVRRHAAAFIGIAKSELVEGMILEYPPGAPIAWHRDAPQFGIVIGISLLNPARMRLKPSKKEGKIVSVTLEPRAIYIRSASARWQWQHSIPAPEKLRYSITFRTLRERESRKTA